MLWQKNNNKQQAKIFEEFKVPLARNYKCSCDINMMILALVVKDLQPFTIVEDEEFVNLLAHFEPRYQPISKKYLTENLLATMCSDDTVTCLGPIAHLLPQMLGPLTQPKIFSLGPYMS